MKAKKKTLNYTLFTLFAAIIILLSMTPLGFIHLGFIKATIVHIPVIIGSIILGPTAGAGLGLIFGINSMINNTPLAHPFYHSHFHHLFLLLVQHREVP
ncbi:ECF transporter S component [Erysipelothrix piscisicarius]|uniref:ECF transporter S component n=1 Tax=Erysipelothrix piscisicarius TaxID=2485784 RepID=UPI002F929977